MSEAKRRPLDGMRVLEMGQLIAGPYAGQVLAGFGADVVKLEPPGRGDPLRGWRALDESGTSFWWHSISRNKRSLTLDLSSDTGREIARRLMNEADVVLENFRAGRMEQWGLGPESFRDTNPDLIYARVSGYGQTGPYASRVGFASACEAVGGMRYVNGHPGEAPVRANLSLGDSFAGLHAVVGILLALLGRQRGVCGGQTVDVSIVESVFAMLEGVYSEFDGAGVVREPSGTTVTGIVPTNTYRCADGRFVVIGGNGDSIFKRLMQAAGRADMADDPALAHNRGRVIHERRIDKALADWASSQSAEALLDALATAQVPAGPINSIAEIATDPHFIARESFEPVDVGGTTRRVPALHPKLEHTPARTDTAGPALGEHSSQVLKDWLDASDDELGSWSAADVI